MVKTPRDQIHELQKQFKQAREQSFDASEDHFMLVNLDHKVDLIGIAVLGNGDIESSLIFQMLEIQRWRSALTKLLWAFLVPLSLGFIFFFFGLIWMLLTKRAEIMFH